MTASLLYCGDTSLDGAAAYLAGLMASWDWRFDYVPSDQPVSADAWNDRSVVILSDYPAANLDVKSQTRLVEAVSSGCGLLMIGGWESFHGVGGDWDQSLLAEILPVVVQATDDRLNCDQPVVVRYVQEHPIGAGLPWQERPPVIGGFNRFAPAGDATVVLEADRLAMSQVDGRWMSTVVETHPLLVVGQHGNGRTAAIATDVAPHWVGGFVDWGDGRVTGQANGAEAIEVGDLYAQFWRQLLLHLTGH